MEFKSIIHIGYQIVFKFKYICILTLLMLFVQNNGVAQKKNKKVEKYKYFSSALSYRPQSDKITFITNNALPRPNYTSTSTFDNSHLNFGLSYQTMNQKLLFQEYSLTRLSYSNDESLLVASYQYGPDTYIDEIRSGFTSTTFIMAIRYEIGKYFLKNEVSKFNLGLSGAVEPSYFYYSSTPQNSIGFPARRIKMSFDLAIIPRISYKLGNRISLIAKIIPTTRIVSIGRYKTDNPNLPISARKRPINNDSFDFNLTASIQVCYSINDPSGKKSGKKRRRR